MANRNVFKILSSFGPGGCVVTFVEKICHNVFYDAYEQGDPSQAPSQEFQEKAKQTRQQFVEELFEGRGRFERQLQSLSEATQEATYKELAEIILKYKVRVVKAEQSRLARERLFYKSTSVQYKRLVEAARRVDFDTTDNLIKMANHIVKMAELEKLTAEFGAASGSSVGLDMEGQHIESRISQARAGELLAEWKKILFDFEKEGNDLSTLFGGSTAGDSLLNDGSSFELENLKDKLFIATGED